MQKSICHITVLNPVTHTRIFYKLALSQQLLGFQVSIIGRGEENAYRTEKEMHLYHIRYFRRLALKRFAYAFYILPRAIKIRADIYTLHSPELLGLGYFLKIFLKARIIYDVHEDYAANIRGGRHYPRWLRHPLARLIRSWERLAMRWVDAVSYAETCYDNMLGAKNVFVLPNTFQAAASNSDISLSLPEHPYLLYSGTIAKEWGLFEAIEIWESLTALRPFELVIAGHTHQGDLLEDLQERIQASSYSSRIHVVGGRQYVPYADILHLIRHCEMGMGLYHLLPHIQDKIPTKFYEYMAADKPLLYSPNPVWKTFDAEHRLGIGWEKTMDADELLQHLDAWKTSPPEHDPSSYAWEEALVQNMLKSILKR
ncbi:MAG: glycosyltransferase [Bacteroidota bacterium]